MTTIGDVVPADTKQQLAKIVECRIVETTALDTTTPTPSKRVVLLPGTQLGNDIEKLEAQIAQIEAAESIAAKQPDFSWDELQHMRFTKITLEDQLKELRDQAETAIRKVGAAQALLAQQEIDARRLRAENSKAIYEAHRKMAHLERAREVNDYVFGHKSKIVRTFELDMQDPRLEIEQMTDVMRLTARDHARNQLIEAERIVEMNPAMKFAGLKWWHGQIKQNAINWDQVEKRGKIAADDLREHYRCCDHTEIWNEQLYLKIGTRNDYEVQYRWYRILDTELRIAYADWCGRNGFDANQVKTVRDYDNSPAAKKHRQLQNRRLAEAWSQLMPDKKAEPKAYHRMVQSVLYTPRLDGVDASEYGPIEDRD